MEAKNPSVIFGQWFRQIREEKGLDLSKLAERSNVPLGTVMRAENGEHQMTLNTAVRLSYGLDLSPEEILLGLRGHESKVTVNPMPGLVEGGIILKIGDLQQFGEFYKSSPEACKELIALLLNALCQKRNIKISYMSQDISHLLYPNEVTPWQQNQVVGPDMSDEQVCQLFKSGSVITRSELTDFLSQIAEKYSLLKGSNKNFTDFWNRNRTKSEGWGIKLEDLLDMDDFLFSNGMAPGGLLLGLWWSNEYFNTRLYRPYIAPALESGRGGGLDNPPWTYEMAKATQIFHKVYRWLENYQINEDLAPVIYKTLAEKR